MTADPQTGRPVNDMRELYAVQLAITDAGGTLTPGVHKALDALREVWDRELRREQQRNAGPAAVPVSAAAPDRAALRERIKLAIHSELTEYRLGRGPGMIVQRLTDAALAVLPPPADRAAILREAEGVLRAQWKRTADAFTDGDILHEDGPASAVATWQRAADLLRRLAAETAGPEAQAEACAQHPDAPVIGGMCGGCTQYPADMGTRLARPRCPHCQLPHDLTPGSMAVRACASILASIDERDAAEAQVATETVHGCPPDGSGLTPCCGRTPFELPLGDRISSEAPVTCPAASAAVQTEEA